MDYQYMLLWWTCIFIIGLVFLPLTSILFTKFFDKGYLFSKTIGIVILSYLIWLLSSIKLVPFNRVTVIGALIAAALVFFVILLEFYGKLSTYLPSVKHIKIFILEELIFLSALAFWTFLRGLKPEIQGLEKFMDLGYVNAILKSTYMPPVDMWFAGKSINYYYFGHYITAFLTNLSGISSSITYNLMMATLFAFTFALTLSLVSNMAFIWKNGKMAISMVAGTISAFIISLSGNLHTFVFTGFLPFLKNIGIPINPKIEIRPSYWFPDATRYIGYNPPVDDKTIHEFPLYSFVVSDLHAHVINIPFVLTIIAAIFMLLVNSIDEIKDGKQPANPLNITSQLGLITLLIGIFQMANYWDFPIYLTVAGITIFYINLMRYQYSLKSIIFTAVQGFIILAGSMLVSLPFSLNFSSITNGIGKTHSMSPLNQLFVLWGYQICFVIYFIIIAVFIEKRHIISSKVKHVKNKNNTTKVILPEGFWARMYKLLKELSPVDIFIMIISLSAIGLVLMPEIIYVKDIYVGAYYRSNTMFKLTYQSFIMFSIAVGFIFVRIISVKRSSTKNFVLGIVLTLVLILPMIYPSYAIKGWYGELKTSNYKGLDGLNFLKNNYPDDYNAVLWLNQNIKGQPVVLEANGDSYTDYARISMATGLPTIQGWYTHEWLWRNNVNIVNDRVKEVSTVYESDDLTATKDILKKYDVQYIVIGKLERDKFKNLKESKLLELGNVEFNSPTMKIIKINKGGA